MRDRPPPSLATPGHLGSPSNAVPVRWAEVFGGSDLVVVCVVIAAVAVAILAACLAAVVAVGAHDPHSVAQLRVAQPAPCKAKRSDVQSAAMILAN